LSVLARQRVIGLEHIPNHPYIIASNHPGFLDGAFVYGQIGGPHITGWAAEKYKSHLIFGTVLRAGGAIFIERGEVDRAAIDAAVEWLEQGGSFGLSPEGTRSRGGGLKRAKTGVAFLADRARVPVVPAAITGTEAVGRSLARLRRPLLTITFGEPFRLSPVSSDNRAADLRANADEIMCRIAAMLPPAYRGEYADHPRTRQLLSEGYGQPPMEPSIA
jgi:1-acyl-sn-glycerol-3-phosphate acyltransferase